MNDCIYMDIKIYQHRIINYAIVKPKGHKTARSPTNQYK